MDIGPRIKSARKDRDMTQEELAQRAGVTLSLISRVERGLVTDLHFSTLSGVARALSMPISELIGEESVVAPLGEAPPSPAETGDDEERRPPISAEIVEEHRALFGICATVLDEINGTFGPYLEELSADPTPEQWEAESRLIDEGLSVIEAVINKMSKYGVTQKLEPYVAAIADGEPVPSQLRQEVIDLFNAQRALYARVIPLAKKKRLTRFGGAELEKLATIDVHADEWRARELAKVELQ